MHLRPEFIFFIAIVSLMVSALLARNPCNIRSTQYGYVCLCDETYCDSLDGPLPQSRNEYTLVTTSRDKDRFVYKTGRFGEENTCCKNKKYAYLEIDTSETYQTMQGFGGAYTGAVTHVVSKLSSNLQRCLFRSYFSHSDGMAYSYLRIPIGGSDFDFTPWAYNEYPENDAKLSNFTKLDPRDLERNAQLKDLKSIAKNPSIKLLAAAWGPPKWMKFNNEWKGGEDSQLKPKYYQTWAEYHLKWLRLMDKDGLQIWAMSTGNEPKSAIQIPFQSVYWTPENQAKWIAENLGPMIKNSSYSHVELHGLDENRDLAPAFIDGMAKTDERSLNYLTGLEFHAYSDKSLEPTILDQFQDRFPNKQIWYTEMCFGTFFMTQFPGPRLGTWGRAQRLSYIIIENLCHSTVGYMDWNIVLNYEGGPSNFNNIDSPIIVSKDFKEMYKQPIFYVMAHFSKFIPTGSIRIGTRLSGHGSRALRVVAFKRPDNKITVIIYNNASKKTVYLTINDKTIGNTVLVIKPKSINTFIYSY